MRNRLRIKIFVAPFFDIGEERHCGADHLSDYPFGAETVREVFERVYRCLDDIRRDYAGKCVMLAMHGGAARAVHVYFNGFPKDGTLKSLVTPNAEPVRFEIADDAPAHTPVPEHV